MNKAELSRRSGVANSIRVKAIFGDLLRPAPNAPDPGQFGLTAAQVAFFQSTDEPSQVLPWVLAWVGFFCAIVSPVGRWVFGGSKEESALRWWLLLLFYLPGAGLGFLINRITAALLERRKLRHTDWPAYERYEKACQENEDAWYAELEREEQRRREEDRRRRKQVEWWKSLDGFQFEKELAELFSSRGIETRLRGGSADGGVDIELQSTGKRVLVQCKAHQSHVSPGPVRELYGTLLREKAAEAWLVTTSGFHSGAREFAAGKPIRLMTIDEILKDTSAL